MGDGKREVVEESERVCERKSEEEGKKNDPHWQEIRSGPRPWSLLASD
jgi:hypothetical protein